MAETTRRGFHGLEQRIHELEAEDRKAPERERDRERERKLDEAEVAAAEIKPPPAHEE